MWSASQLHDALHSVRGTGFNQKSSSSALSFMGQQVFPQLLGLISAFSCQNKTQSEQLQTSPLSSLKRSGWNAREEVSGHRSCSRGGGRHHWHRRCRLCPLPWLALGSSRPWPATGLQAPCGLCDLRLLKGLRKGLGALRPSRGCLQ